MKKIMFVGSWGESPKNMLSRYSNQTPDNNGVWGNICGVLNPEEADYIIVMDGFRKTDIASIDWSKVIYFQREPNTIAPHFMNHDFPENIFFKGTLNNIYRGQTWWINKSFEHLCNLEYPKKDKKISTITSGKIGIKAYTDRLRFLQDFCNSYKTIDVYGRGTATVVPKCWKGELNYDGDCKYNGHIEYEYSLVLENVHYQNSWTEKPCDSMLAWSLPIYSGASNFKDYFPEKSFYEVDVNNCKVEEIVNFISEPLSKDQIESLREARNLILYKYNIWPTIENIINENL